MFDFPTFFRFFVAGAAGAALAYATCRWHLVRRAGGRRFVDHYLPWLAAFVAFGFVATYDAEPFTYQWLYCAMLDGDWVVALAAPLLFAYIPWRRGRILAGGGDPHRLATQTPAS